MGGVTLLDFGLSRAALCDRHLPAPRRGGVFDAFEPEYCAAILRHDPPPAATFQSDQYSIGALLYTLITGAARQTFSFEQDVWLAQVAQGSPVPFVAHGLAPWPDMEMVLGRALSREPAARYPCVKDFMAAFERVSTPAPVASASPVDPAQTLLGDLLARMSPKGPTATPVPIRAPHCSLTYGAAGIAYFLYRMAALRGAPQYLAAAALWCARARHRSGRDDAFVNADIGITPTVTGRISPFHAESGVHFVQTLVARSVGNLDDANRAALTFVEVSGASSHGADLTLGSSGVLLGCAALLEALPHHAAIDRAPLVQLGVRIAGELSNIMAALPIVEARTMPWLGMAHGWAGMLYALMRWSQATGRTLEEVPRIRLRELSALGRGEGKTLYWPLGLGDVAAGRAGFTGWCHGSAGYLMLWTLACQLIGDEHQGAAEGAARHIMTATSEPARNVGASLCCGYAGQGFALISYHLLCGSPAILRDAADRCRRAVDCVDGSDSPDSLFHGKVGVAMLVEALRRPELSAMPVVEAEGWNDQV